MKANTIKKAGLEELVSDRVAIFLKQHGSAVTVVPFLEPKLVPVGRLGKIMHPTVIVNDPQFNSRGWKQGYTTGEMVGEKVMVQYYRYKVGVYDPPGN